MSVQEVLEAVCNKRQLNPNDHFIRLKLGQDSYRIPEKSSFMENEVRYSIDVCFVAAVIAIFVCNKEYMFNIVCQTQKVHILSYL